MPDTMTLQDLYKELETVGMELFRNGYTHSEVAMELRTYSRDLGYSASYGDEVADRLQGLETMTETRTEPILVSTRTEIAATHSSIFGELVKLTADKVTHYHGDLFHDATWIRSHVTDSIVFYWSCDSHGTQIGTDKELVETYRNGPMVKVTVEPVGSSSWEATVERIR